MDLNFGITNFKFVSSNVSFGL